MLMGSKFLIKMARQQNKGHDDQNFYSYQKQEALATHFDFTSFSTRPFSSWLLLFYTWGVFVYISLLFKKILFVIAKM